MPTITLPANSWRPRDYQLPAWKYLERGGKRAICIWHRRAGKDDVCLHWAASSAMQRVGNYWHMLPEASQARKAIWEAVNPHTGLRRIDEAFPRELRETTREQEMMIRFVNGSTWQVVGSDNYNSLVGSPPIGIVFSEWALADPASWAYLRPILLENDGWALFITTPRGRNHAARFYFGAKDDPLWFTDIRKATDTSVFTADQLDQELNEYIREFGPDEGESRFNQEYLCDFEAAIPGAYYARLMRQAEEDGRIGNVPYEPSLPVYISWDLGVGDSTALWFAQVLGREVRLIDYYETSGVGLDHYVKMLREKPYVYANDILPHDIEVRELSSGKSRLETLYSLGRRDARVLGNVKVDDGINAARNLIPRCWFDARRCERGIDALRQYRREWDDKNKVFKPRPLHDWTSHPADSFRYLALGLPGQYDEPEDDDHFLEDYDRSDSTGY